MVLHIAIENYKSIRNASIDLRPGLTVLVGPNGSGKTCVLSSLKFLRDLFQLGAAQSIARQGGPRRVYHRKQTRIVFSFRQNYGTRTFRSRRIPCEWTWRIVVAQAGPESIATVVEEEFLVQGKVDGSPVQLYRISVVRNDSGKPRFTQKLSAPEDFGRDLFSRWHGDYGRRNKTEIHDHFPKTVTKSIQKLVDNEPDRTFFPHIATFDRKTQETLDLFLYLNEYNILPDVARASTEQLPYAQMTPNGGAVSNVIDALENGRYHKLQVAPLFDDDPFGHSGYYYVRRFRIPWRRDHGNPSTALASINAELAAGVRPIDRVSVDIDRTNGRRFVVFKADTETFYPEEVSDGTVKWLCILVSLFVPFSRVYILEEPENFLHPWMQQRLIAIMRDQAKHNQTVFLVSSHSATILNGANPDEILLVKHGAEGTELSMLDDIGSIRELLSDSEFHIGDLWVSGAIGGVPTNE
jgi:predicted ATPase